MKKYLISGIGPGPTGVGRLMNQLLIEADKYEYISLYKFANKPIRKLLKERKFLFLIIELFMRTIKNTRFNFLISPIKNSEVILIHPQSIGINNFKKLVNNNTIVKWYVMDNSFFCMKSYNYLDGECLKCLENFDDIDSSCKPYPNLYTENEYIQFMKFLKSNIKNIKVYAQSDSHKELLQKFYGQDIDITVVGMNTGEFDFSQISIKEINHSKNNTIVFHNYLVDAKGFSFAYDLAQNLPQYKFIFPSKKPTKIKNVPKHINFLDISWDSGLREIVEQARLVLCLSMWSSPIEGALVKSIYCNGNVAIMDNQFGFSTEVPDNIILKLDHDINVAVKQTRDFMNTNTNLSYESKKWLKKQYSSYDILKLFK